MKKLIFPAILLLTISTASHAADYTETRNFQFSSAGCLIVFNWVSGHTKEGKIIFDRVRGGNGNQESLKMYFENNPTPLAIHEENLSWKRPYVIPNGRAYSLEFHQLTANNYSLDVYREGVKRVSCSLTASEPVYSNASTSLVQK